jgi:hypothetical protein
MRAAFGQKAPPAKAVLSSSPCRSHKASFPTEIHRKTDHQIKKRR